MFREPETKKALILVRTYPTPAKQGVEVSCTAAVTEKGEWLRLFPVPWRLLTKDKRFRKYQWVEITVTKASDPRPESYKIKGDSIKILSDPLPTDHDWKARKEHVLPLCSTSLCALQKERDEKGHPTLGVFRPQKINKLIIKPESPNWTPGQLAALRQKHLFEQGPEKELEKVPYSFRYQFRCNDESCSGHEMMCTDWEMGESWRKWSREYGSNWEAAFRQKYETEMIEKHDTYFYVGTVHRHPSAWIIVGIFYPPRSAILNLFNS